MKQGSQLIGFKINKYKLISAVKNMLRIYTSNIVPHGVARSLARDPVLQ